MGYSAVFLAQWLDNARIPYSISLPDPLGIATTIRILHSARGLFLLCSYSSLERTKGTSAAAAENTPLLPATAAAVQQHRAPILSPIDDTNDKLLLLAALSLLSKLYPVFEQGRVRQADGGGEWRLPTNTNELGGTPNSTLQRRTAWSYDTLNRNHLLGAKQKQEALSRSQLVEFYAQSQRIQAGCRQQR